MDVLVLSLAAVEALLLADAEFESLRLVASLALSLAALEALTLKLLASEKELLWLTKLEVLKLSALD